jgi:hypothetical protein
VGLVDSLVAGTAPAFCYYAFPGNSNSTCSIVQVSFSHGS